MRLENICKQIFKIKLWMVLPLGVGLFVVIEQSIIKRVKKSENRKSIIYWLNVFESLLLVFADTQLLQYFSAYNRNTIGIAFMMIFSFISPILGILCFSVGMLKEKDTILNKNSRNIRNRLWSFFIYFWMHCSTGYVFKWTDMFLKIFKIKGEEICICIRKIGMLK